MGDFDALDAWEPTTGTKSASGGEFSALDAWDPDAKPAKPAPVDMGPAARRARAGMSPGARDLTSEEAGTMAGPIKHGITHVLASETQEPEPAAYTPPKGTEMRVERYPAEGQGRLSRLLLHNQGPIKSISEGNTAEMADPLVQAGTAGAFGAAAGAVAPELLPGQAAALAARAAPIVEGAVANKAYGGDLTTGAALGALPIVLPLLGRGAAAGSRAMGTNLEARAVKDIVKGKKPSLGASKRAADKVTARAGNEGENLTQTLRELPETRKAVLVTGTTDPAAAAKIVGHDLDAAVAANDADFAAIQREHGGIPLQPYVDRLEALESRLNRMGHGVEADAIGRVRADILKPKRHGLPGKTLTPEQIGELKIPADAVRNIRNDVGSLIEGGPPGTIKPNTKASAMRRVHQILNKEIEDVGEMTAGVDVDALRTRNRQVSTLIPVKKALEERALKLADRDISIVGKAKELPGKAIKSGARRLRYGLSSFPEANPAPAPYAGPTPFPYQLPAPVNPIRERELAALGIAAAAHGAGR